MMLDEAIIRLQVVEWSQIIVHGAEWGPYIFRVNARTSDTEEVVYGPEGYPCRHSWDWPPEKFPERGIGVLGYYPERPARDDIDGMDEFVGGGSGYRRIYTTKSGGSRGSVMMNA